jgi:hypothetical protein
MGYGSGFRKTWYRIGGSEAAAALLLDEVAQEGLLAALYTGARALKRRDVVVRMVNYLSIGPGRSG